MKRRNIAFVAALTGWIALTVYYVTFPETTVAKEVQTTPKTVGETLSAIAQGFKHEGRRKKKAAENRRGQTGSKSSPLSRATTKGNEKGSFKLEIIQELGRRSRP